MVGKHWTFPELVRTGGNFLEPLGSSVDCCPELRQSGFGHSSAKGEEHVPQSETKVRATLSGGSGERARADEKRRKRQGLGRGTGCPGKPAVLVEAASRRAHKAERSSSGSRSPRPAGAAAGKENQRVRG